MSGSMPYHWEKGVLNLLLEKSLNGRAGPPEASRREEMGRILDALREPSHPPNWVLGVLPQFERDTSMAPIRHAATGRAVLDHFAEHWLGMDFDRDLDRWVPGARSDRTGWWLAYKGDVSEIVRQALIFALELALGLGHGAALTTGPDADPHVIELFDVCTFPWFEAWVVHRPTGGDQPGRKLISVCFLTPSHVGSQVAKQPIATEASAAAGADQRAVPSFEDDYDELLNPYWARDLPLADHRPRKKATERSYATWVVTHRRHQPAEPLTIGDTARPSAFGDWSPPRMNVWEGVDDVVIVSPSLAAGGVTHDGELPPPPTHGKEDRP